MSDIFNAKRKKRNKLKNLNLAFELQSGPEVPLGWVRELARVKEAVMVCIKSEGGLVEVVVCLF